MQGAAHIMMTLDIGINFWLTDSYLRAMKKFIKKFYGGYPDLIGKYQRSVKDMVADVFTDQFNAMVQLVLSLSLFFKFYY